jgi:signal transduction histidine kinase
VELPLLLDKVIGLLEHKIADKNIHVNIAADETLPAIQADPDQLEQVLLNLFLNSLHALRHGGAIRINAALIDSDGSGIVAADGGVRIEFEDNGDGIPAEHLSQVFDPFFTTKDVGEGTGLGLSVSYGIIKDHGGEIRVESKPGEFTRFIIVLPAHGHETGAAPRSIAV